ncbi:hypothetical protein AKJ51_02875 [candidate division MSBL1 archaeon SCGC-AAA382A20]|uniref:Uncharacterized protein n=1 Tax=candidate division MSBL1 archaeon SCGC-AAA382A20 TaxID=1698280 RepID=A0A133VK25_9EURY|nr:hypothetical protein AKJ51_02875 [candidate division MSBL1 archaeon SCGC-AAA382A20]
MQDATNIEELRTVVGNKIDYYNTQRRHSQLDIKSRENMWSNYLTRQMNKLFFDIDFFTPHPAGGVLPLRKVTGGPQKAQKNMSDFLGEAHILLQPRSS